MKTIIVITLILLNLSGFAMMLFDKHRAKSGGWRVPEKRLFLIAFIGGAVGIFIGMRLVRHKTQHTSFIYGIPFCMLLNFIFLYPLIYYSPVEWFSILFSLL